MVRTGTKGIGIAAMLALATSAMAADRNPAPSAEAAPSGWENGGDIYGFSDNPDTPGKVGPANVKLGWIGLNGKRFGRYQVLTTTLESEYGLADWLSVTPSISLGAHNLNDVPLVLGDRLAALAAGETARDAYFYPNRNRGSFSALAAGFKMRLIERGKLVNGQLEGSPIGLAVTMEPKWTAVDDATGNRLTAFSFASAIIADTAIIPERLFWTVNLGAGLTSGRDRDARAPVHASSLALSSALSYQFAPGVFLGVEARHERAYDGNSWKTYLGNATYLGPTLFLKSGNWGLQAAWNAQIAGHAKDEPGQKLNLSQFERHRARLRLSYDF
ncbi:MAG TPA: hypothetical protein PLQ11_03525 [Beijerinckiaceae bacterium]|nr:hypothetical protein [Beijerinckiaceae bacterium]